jgi:hypothetical protein
VTWCSTKKEIFEITFNIQKGIAREKVNFKGLNDKQEGIKLITKMCS